jgi:6-phosphogluconolactonase
VIGNTFPDAEALALAAAGWFSHVLAASDGRVAVALSGGSTPKRMYELLGAEPLRQVVPWERVHLFWGDERFVPESNPRSNQRMVREAMLDHVPIPPGNVHALPTGEGLTAEQAAAEYARTLAQFYGSDQLDPARPLFEIVLLGLGTNGHTASLFPGETALDERERWAVAVAPPGEPVRVTLTYPPLESTRYAAFLIAGAEKRPMLERLRAGDESIPAGRYAPKGELLLFADRAASGA